MYFFVLTQIDKNILIQNEMRNLYLKQYLNFM